MKSKKLGFKKKDYFWSVGRPPRPILIDFKLCIVVVNIIGGKVTKFGMPTAP